MNSLFLLATQGVYSSLVQATAACTDPRDIDCVLAEGSETFAVVQTVFTFIGIIIVFYTMWRVIKALLSAKPADAVKTFVGGLVASVFCFNIQLPLKLVDSVGKVFGKAFETISKLLG